MTYTIFHTSRAITTSDMKRNIPSTIPEERKLYNTATSLPHGFYIKTGTVIYNIQLVV